MQWYPVTCERGALLPLLDIEDTTQCANMFFILLKCGHVSFDPCQRPQIEMRDRWLKERGAPVFA